ncbi:hypothetical protein RD792_004404 [Penstemon davidsonii]|uniref:RING-type E3 ubiquitin transferase n=1 Tax=Penstemon davidsonii TaxID=160366 RepID=A0ABR0DI35_9LAMI|nr:hypothetical protein RD792_004404 [Penstemon davidsonii]
MFTDFDSFRALCKFFAHGACLKGDHCEFSHDWNAPPNNVTLCPSGRITNTIQYLKLLTLACYDLQICTFYQKGSCSYGSRCRYDHVEVSRSLAPPPSASVYHPFPVGSVSGTTASNVPSQSPISPAWGETSGHHVVLETDEDADQSICSFAAAGDCPRGEKCPHIHGDLCLSCGKHCLHPFRPEEREEHIKTCEKRQKHLVALRHSQEIECSVCLERVLSKPTPTERKFGILLECDHPFCVSCIRNWRSSSPASGLDVNSALRACPICRKLSYFVIPSVIWYSSKEEEMEIVDSYMEKLKYN